jgi:amino acid transporter
VALNFAEVSSHYPLAGSVFQWTKFLANRTYSWFTGWIYLFAGILTVTAVVATLPLALIPALNGLGWHSLNAGSLNTQLVVALITLVVITILNIYGVKLVSIINNTGVVFEILGMFVFALVLMAFHNHQGFGVVTRSAGIPVNGSTFLAAMFMSLFVIYGFDTASTLSEETKDPRLAATIRLCFGMARDNQLPGSKVLSRVSPSLHTPMWSCIAVAAIAAIPFWQYSGAGIIAIAATGMIYLSYFLGNIVIMRRVRPALRTSTRQPPEIVRGPGTTLYGQIEDWLAGEIATGALVPGDRLPTEHDLAEWFGVSG